MKEAAINQGVPKVLHIAKKLEEKAGNIGDAEEFVLQELRELMEKREQYLSGLTTKVDHFVRAQREIEAPIIQKMSEERLSQEKKQRLIVLQTTSEKNKQTWEVKKEMKNRLMKLKPDTVAFEEIVRKKKKPAFDSEYASREEKRQKWREEKLKQYHQQV